MANFIIGNYFKPEYIQELSRYLKGFIPKISNSQDLCKFLDNILEFHTNDPNLIYDGYMFRGIGSDIPLTISNVDEMQYGSWSKNRDIANNFAETSGKEYKYILIRKGISIDPSKIKEVSDKIYPNTIFATGMDTYNPHREKEVIAPLKRKECQLIDITHGYK